jgi:acyl-CoA dehydrogenase
MGLILTVAVIVGVLVAIARMRASFKTWSMIIGAGLLLLTLAGAFSFIPGLLLWALFLIIALALNVPEWRRRFVSNPMLRYIRRALPPISDTEREAIEAGTVWWDAQLFSGDPDWRQLLEVPTPKLSDEEQAFLDGPVEELCRMADDWQITHELNDLPREIWDFLATHRFYGLNIPKKYGGHEFSPLANSAIVVKVASRSGTAGVTVMVPNSLGPAELLLHYGTEAQKDYYLPRLAKGEEIPCFALTNPEAGSDAGAIPDYGIVCQAEYQGEQVLGLRVSWEKRYITLGPVATLLGLAFKAYDPDHLLGDVEDLGMTCALVPADTPGVDNGQRHYPLNAAFQNGPNSGQDVFIPMDWVIGGREWVGKGWRMLMESLAAGRGISLPASATAGAKVAARTTGAYARVREQFNVPIGKFEGVEEALARIGGVTYMMDAARLLTTSALMLGEKPSVISAIVKYHLTEGVRQVINDAMDVHGGRGICMGPSNYLARSYQQIPIAITVEGANILTRSMIIFGQGAMRCHPYLLQEITSASHPDPDIGSEEFDQALFSHFGFSVTNAARAFVYGLSRRLAPAPVDGLVADYYRGLSRHSAAFSFLADVTLLILGGGLKRKEKLSGRFSDALSYLFIGSAVLKHFQDTGRPSDDLPLVAWSCQFCMYQIQQALDGVLRNFPVRGLGWVLRGLVFPLGRRHALPGDRVGHQVAKLLQQPSATRDRLTAGIYLNEDPDDVIGCLDVGLHKVLAADPAKRTLRAAGVEKPPHVTFEDWLKQLIEQDVISEDDAVALTDAHHATRKVIMVDAFEPGERQLGSTANRAA